MTLVANCKFATGVIDTSGKQENKYQTADNLKCTKKKKKILYDNSTTQRCPKEIMQIFLIEDLFHLPPLSMTLVVHLELRISPQILIRNGHGILRGLGETDS
jgi:hypothetical protein